jgi:hypothetical protein
LFSFYNIRYQIAELNIDPLELVPAPPLFKIREEDENHVKEIFNWLMDDPRAAIPICELNLMQRMVFCLIFVYFLSFSLFLFFFSLFTPSFYFSFTYIHFLLAFNNMADFSLTKAYKLGMYAISGSHTLKAFAKARTIYPNNSLFYPKVVIY